MNTLDININDFFLPGGQDYQLTVLKDLELVGGNIAIISGALRRILVWKGTWYEEDPNFGSELNNLLQLKSPQQVTNDELYDIILDAISPMIEDGRIGALNEVNIIEASRSNLKFQVIFTVNSQVIGATLTQTV